MAAMTVRCPCGTEIEVDGKAVVSEAARIFVAAEKTLWTEGAANLVALLRGPC